MVTGQPMTFGAEEEYLLVDAATGDLVPRADEAVEAATKVLDGEVAHELNLCQVEVETPVCTTLDQLEAELRSLRTTLAEACKPLGLAPLASASHPFSSWDDQAIDRSSQRYAAMEDRYQMLARRQIICGYHVHIGIEDRASRVEAMNRVRPWLPLLLALSANSPFWQGADSGYASYRTQVWLGWPTSGMPPTLDGPEGYDELVDALVRGHAIEDATHLYWYVRPSERYPTLEFRVSDVCLDVADAVTIAGLVRALAAAGVRGNDGPLAMPTDRPPLATVYELRAAIWRAARYGVEGSLVDPETGETGPAHDVIRSAVERLGPALDVHGDRDRVEEGVEAILTRGNGAAWQRRIAGGSDLRALATAMAERTPGPAPLAPAAPQR